MSLSWESVTPSTRSLSAMSLHSLNSVWLMGRTSGWKGLRGSLSAELFAQARRRYELPGSRETWSAVESRRKAALPPAPPISLSFAPAQRTSSSGAKGGVAARGRTPTARSIRLGGARIHSAVPAPTDCGPSSVPSVTEPLDPRPVFNLARLKDVDGLSCASDNVLERQVEAELVNQFHAVVEIPTESEPAKVLALSA
eukprot:gene15911-33513_t